MTHTHTESPNAVITESVRIDRPAGEVFAYVSNYENDPLWREAIVSMTQTPPGQPSLGTTTEEVLQMMGIVSVTTAEVVEHEPGRRIAFRSTMGPAEAAGYRLVEAAGDECVFTYHLGLRLTGDHQAMASVIGAEIGQMVRRDLERLKALLEAAVPANA